MGDYNFSIPYNLNSGTTDKYCRYTYSSWCATCKTNSPRRRSKSETIECCKKKCKILTPKKYNKSNEYENMEVECDSTSWHDIRYDCCRLRSNLVELPTSYISNNSQMSPNMSISKNDVHCLKSLKSYEHSTIFTSCDWKSNIDILDTMESRRKILEHEECLGKINTQTTPLASISSYLKSNNFSAQKSRLCSVNQDIQNSNYSDKTNKTNYFNCKEYCQLMGLWGHIHCVQNPICFDTNTYFNRPIDRERYSMEVDYLREKLKMLQNCSYNMSQEISILNLDVKDDTHRVITTTEIKPKILKKHIPFQSIKPSRSKISLKTKKPHVIKTKKIKGKVANENPLSENSGSESDTLEDYTVQEDSESILSKYSVSIDSSIKNITEAGFGESESWPVRFSLFPNIPPYIKFRAHDLDLPCKVPDGRKFFKWKLSTITPIIVRKTLSNSGFALVRKSNQWLGTWGKHMKSPMFKTMKETHKLNHFPGTFQLGRKDRLWKNFQKMISKYGLKEFGFLPHTYVLPQELKLLKQNWDFKNSGGKEMWIIKPPASARGVGIKVINKWSHLPKKTSLVCQKYVNNPYLINGSKFDLRLYVLVTSFHPLRIYLYPEGLARFASAKYSDDIKDLKDRYMHLTNYSINKLSSQYTSNEDANACQGHKWTLSKLLEYLEKDGIDTTLLWKNLEQLVIKTIISSEALITSLCEENMNSYYNCYELFGIDVLLDEHLKPWLLEVNISPSLHSASPLDAHVKGPLVQTLFDMAQFHFPYRLGQNVKNAPQCFDGRIYTRALTKKERTKHIKFTQIDNRGDYVYDILKELTGDDIRHLIRAEDELVVKGKFERIFPTYLTHKYLDFMEARYYNRLFDAWESKYASRREDGITLLQTLCAQKVHLRVGNIGMLNKSSQSTSLEPISASVTPSENGHTFPVKEILQDAPISKKISSPLDDI